MTGTPGFMQCCILLSEKTKESEMLFVSLEEFILYCLLKSDNLIGLGVTILDSIMCQSLALPAPNRIAQLPSLSELVHLIKWLSLKQNQIFGDCNWEVTSYKIYTLRDPKTSIRREFSP